MEDLVLALIAVAELLIGTWLLCRYSSTATRVLATGDVGVGVFVAGTSFAVLLTAHLRLLPLLSGPLPYAADIERLYRLTAFSTWDHLAHPQDYHHPGLWFALLHEPFELSGHSVLVPAAFDRACAVLVVPIVGAIVLGYAGRLAALAAMLNVALLPFLTTQASALSDVTLFILLGTVSILAYGRARVRPTVGRFAALGAALSLAVNASYAAPVLVAALLIDAALKRERRLPLVMTLLIASLAGAARFWHLALLLPTEFATRSALGRLAIPHWATESVSRFVVEAATDYLTPAFPVVLVPLAAALWVGRALLFRRATELGWTILASVLFLCAQPVLRIRPYYASLIPIALLALVASLAAIRQPAEDMPVAARRRVLALVASAVCSIAFAMNTPAQPDPRQADEIAARTVVQAALADGATRLASSNWTESTWYFFTDPLGTMSACIRHDPGRRCRPTFDYDEDETSGRRYYGLSQGPVPADDQDQQSIAKLRRVQTEGTTHLLVDRSVAVDNALSSYAQAHCTRLAQAEWLEMWRCPKIDPPDAAGADGARD